MSAYKEKEHPRDKEGKFKAKATSAPTLERVPKGPHVTVSRPQADVGAPKLEEAIKEYRARAARPPFDASKHLVQGEAAETYYQQLHDKHFNNETATGSVFTDPRVRDLSDLLTMADEQEGGLCRNDRDKYEGADPAAFRDTNYYVRVEGVQGLSGAVLARDVPPNTELVVRTTKDGVPPDLVWVGGGKQQVDHATIVMVDERDKDGEPTGRRIVLTAFPGEPMGPVGEHRRDWEEGTTILARDVDPRETILCG